LARAAEEEGIIVSIPDRRCEAAGVILGDEGQLEKKDLQFALPFGTFLAPAAFLALVWGDRIIHAYLILYGR
jgi:prepilin signal peptidase PulO-like enzyme (type II secretory pathway)